MTSATQALAAAFRPRSVAIVGASDRPGKLNTRVLDHLLDNGYTGTVYPVNPRLDSVRGIRCYPSVADIPGHVDVGYVLVPAEAAVGATQELAAAGATTAIIAAAGFAEDNTDAGRRRESQLREVSKSGCRIIGPNCNGIYNAVDFVSIGFNVAHGMALPPGGMAVVSHSGAIFSTLMQRAQQVGVGLSSFASVGNEVDLDVLDFMEYLVLDEDTRCISLIIDSVADGARFADLTARARAAGKGVIALKLGTSAAGSTAAVAHSSRMAGSSGAYAALLRHCGVGVVHTLEQLVVAAALIDRRLVTEPVRLGVSAMSGGAGVIAADAAERNGVRLAELTGSTMRRIQEMAPGTAAVNPLDFGSFIHGADYADVLDLLRHDDEVNIVLSSYHPVHDAKMRRWESDAITRDGRGSAKPHLLLAPGGLHDDEAEAYRAAGVVVAPDTETCMAGLAAASRSTTAYLPADRAGAVAVDLPDAVGALDDADSMAILRSAGVPMAAWRVAATASQAAAAAADLGFPVVLKGLVQGMAHKTEHGLVVVGVQDADECRQESERLLAAGAGKLVVQEMVAGEVEALVGLVTEPGLGPFVLVGLGGIHAEQLDDAAVLPVSASREEIVDALGRTRLGAVLTSPRLALPRALDQVVDVVERLADLGASASRRLQAVDINPLIITKKAVVAVDGLVVLRDEASVDAS